MVQSLKNEGRKNLKKEPTYLEKQNFHALPKSSDAHGGDNGNPSTFDTRSFQFLSPKQSCSENVKMIINIFVYKYHDSKICQFRI